MDKRIKKESENEFNSLEEENKIIEEIIKNQLIKDSQFDIEYEDLEEDEYEEDLSEKDKVTEEILNNKMSFIVHDDNEKQQNENNINQKKIQKDIIEDLLIELFNFHYNGIIGQKRKNPQSRMFSTKYHIEFFFTKLNINYIYLKYILLILDEKIKELIQYIKNKFYKKKISVKDILNIKKSLFLVGINIGKIFEYPFEKTRYFDISSVLEVLFISDILNNNDIEINDKEYEEIINISKLDEKDNFEKYIEECKTYFDKFEKEEDTKIEEDNNNKNNKKGDEKNNNKNKIKIIDKQMNNNGINDPNNYLIKSINNKINNKNDILNEKIQINKIRKEKYIKNCSDEDVNNNNIIEKNDSLTVEDLLKYINDSDNKKKKKKKRKKKKKLEEKNKDDFEEKDDLIESFKSYIINISENLEKHQKIKPNISQAFLDKL